MADNGISLNRVTINESDNAIGFEDLPSESVLSKGNDFNPYLSGMKSSFERAALEPIYSYKEHATDEFDDVFYKESYQKMMEATRNTETYNAAMSGSDAFGISALRFLPELTASFMLPLKAYSRAIAGTKAGGKVVTGLGVGSAEGLTYFEAREGYRDPTAKEYLLATGLSGVAGHYIGKGHRGYNLGRGAEMDDIHIDEVVKSTLHGINNNKANIQAASKKAMAIAKTGSILGLGVYASEAEAGWFSSASRVGVKSTSDVAHVISKNIDEIGDVGVALNKASDELVPSLSDYQTVAKSDLVDGFIESVGYEIGKAFKPTRVDNAIDDIVNQSSLLEKNAPLEVETVLRNNIDEILPSGVGKNDEIRESLGHVFRTGAKPDDVDAFLRGSNIKEDIAMSNIVGKLDDIQLTKLNKAIDDIAKNTFDKSYGTPLGKNSNTVLKKMGLDVGLAKHVDDIIVNRAMKNLPKEHIDNLATIRSTNPREIDSVFGFRTALNTKTQKLVDSGQLNQADADFAYSSSTYKGIDKDTQTVILTPDEMKQVDSVQGVSKALNKVFRNNNMRVVSKKQLEDGNFEVTMQNRNDFVQGPILKKQEQARTRIDNKLENPESVQSFKGTPTKIDMNIESNGVSIAKNKSISNQEYKATLKDLENKGIQVQDKSVVTHSAQPLTRAEQEFLGVSDDIADVAGKTTADVQRQLGTEAMYSRVKREYSTRLTGEHPHEFTQGFARDPKYLFVSAENNALKNPEIMQTLANNYIKIDDQVLRIKTGADYVSKEHAFTLMGYNKVYATEYTYSMTRFVENMYRDMVQTFRTSVVLKNPVSMVNNLVAMSFTNFAYQFMSKGRLSGQAFKGLPSAYKGYKDFVGARATLMNMKASGASSETLIKYRKEFLEGTPAYELYKRGGLQSLLDDGLADRAIRTSKEEGPIEYGVRSVFLAEDTKAGQVARKISDMGDIVNRINMFDELVKGGMHADEAAREVQKMAVNYTRILSPSFNFARETGLSPFITWYSRFLPQFAKLISDNPMRAAKLQGMYLIMQASAGSEDNYGNDYIAGVNVNNWNAFNVFNPSDIGDVFNGPVTGILKGEFSPKSLIPAHINQVLDDRVRLVTTK